MKKLGVRTYVNIIGSSLPTTSRSANGSWIFSGNVDLIYRPTQNIGIFIGLGLGSILNIERTLHSTGIDPYFVIMSNYGVQYNIDKNNILEISAILNQVFNFSYNTITPFYSIMAKYAYRF